MLLQSSNVLCCSFLWAVCQLNQLSQHHAEWKVLEALPAMPTALEDTYKEQLMNIKPADAALAISMFKWLAFSTRPLSIQELADAVAIDAKDELDPSQRSMNPIKLLDIVLSFVAVQMVSRLEFETMSTATLWAPFPRIHTASHNLAKIRQPIQPLSS